MADRRLATLSDAELEGALGGLAGTIAWPAPTLGPGGPDLATRVRARIVADPDAARGTRATRGRRTGWLPARRALVLALLAVLALAAVAGAVGLGLPGIRLILGEPPATALPGPSGSVRPSLPPGPPGSGLGLGAAVAVAELEARAGYPVRLPTDPALPAPDAAYVDDLDRTTLVWAPTAALPPTEEPGVGLLLSQFEGRIHPSAVTKILGAGTTLERVTVDGHDAFWIGGDAHFYFYEGPDGEFIEDSRRWVGDALIWSDGVMTYRLETALGRDAAIRIGESLE